MSDPVCDSSIFYGSNKKLLVQADTVPLLIVILQLFSSVHKKKN